MKMFALSLVMLVGAIFWSWLTKLLLDTNFAATALCWVAVIGWLLYELANTPLSDSAS